MADACISMVLNRLAPMIEKKVREEVCLMLNANDEAEKLALKLKKIQEVLMDAEQQGVMDRKVKSWLEKLQDISYDIDEVLDLWDVEIQKRRLDELDDAASESSDSLLHKVSSFLQSVCLCFRESIERRTMAKDIKKLNERLDLIAQENENEFKFIPNLSRGSQDFERIIDTSSVEVSEVQGRDSDLKLLMEKLFSKSCIVEEDGVQIVSLVGMGGMGKTTLAQLAFNDVITGKDHFDVKIWVDVSHPFDDIKIAKAILEAVNGNSPNLSQLETLLQSIKRSITKKRFLLVLDDVWTEVETKWKPLKITLIKNGDPGSRILVTTRNKNVAKIMGSTQIQSLDPLSDSCCWLILSQIAFHERNEGDCDMLKEIGWQIALKCKGMPLAAKALGRLLQWKNSLQEWENVLRSKLWEMHKETSNIFPILALSYNELDPAVKRCFSYCAIFPKNSYINVDDLIRIWMAQGFLHSTGTSCDMEQKGREYFTDLAMRSFFQDFRRDWVVGRNFRRGLGPIESFKMHDIVHDFAQFLTNDECLVAENIEVPVIQNVRHLNLLNFEAKTTMDMFSHFQIEKLCSLICERNEIPHNLFNNLKRVKLLKLSGCQRKEIPAEIGNLIHLRFLDVSSNCSLEKLPRSICDLYYLQTLDLRRCNILAGLPHGIHRLVNLKHLFVNGASSVFEFTQGLEKLVGLQSLDYFNCSRGSGNKLGYLKDLNLIGGSLEICIEFLKDGCDNEVDAHNANLKNKECIEHLKLHCVGWVGKRVIDALQPSLKLPSHHFIGSYLPNWITTLSNLTELTIEGVGDEIIDASHSLGNLPFLQHLTLSRLRMQHFRLSKTKPPSAFPNLLTFRLMYCKRLTVWDDTEEENENIMISALPRLKQLEIYGCQQLEALPHRLLSKTALSLEILKLRDCGYLQWRYNEEGDCRDEISRIPIIDIR